MINSSYQDQNIPTKSLKSLKYIFLIFFSYALFNIIINSGSISFLFYSLPILTVLIFIKTKINFQTPKFLFFLILPSIFFIYLNEAIIHNSTSNHIYPSNFYFYLIFLFFLPYIINQLDIKLKNLYFITLIFTIISFIFNTYMNFKFTFDRFALADELSPIIINNYVSVLITLLPLIYSLHTKNKFSPYVITICLLNIITICLQGSRGIWLSLLILTSIFLVLNFKKYKKQIILSLSLSFILLISFIKFNPNNPITQRIIDAQNDYSTLNTTSFEKTSIGQRHVMYETALEQFMLSPLYGSGNEELTHQVFLKNSIAPPHTHNLFLHELGSHGVLGFLGMLSLLLYPIYFSFHQKRLNSSSTQFTLIHHLILFITIFTISCGLTDYTFSFKFSLYLYSFIIVILLNLQSKSFNAYNHKIS